jgi:hypothetical protein
MLWIGRMRGRRTVVAVLLGRRRGVVVWPGRIVRLLVVLLLLLLV